MKKIVPSPRGLVCALSTEERRMDCRMYVEAEVGKKVRGWYCIIVARDNGAPRLL